MRTMLITLALASLALTNIPPAAAVSTDEKPADKVCLTWIPLGPSCAYGEIGHKDKTANCDNVGCDVTFTFKLIVTPAACGRINDIKTDPCAYTETRTISREETIHIPYGNFYMDANLCVAAEPTFTAELCTSLSHVFVVEHPSRDPTQVAATIGGLLGFGGHGGLVGSVSGADIYEGGCLLCM